ncbi:hypothetical protein DFS34DRAFT_406143 [Phlyctochytrium arcticum]|nr:hypothetical protein DFS34DRAFT_406143 [Phlyctochytrium arcticum]
MVMHGWYSRGWGCDHHVCSGVANPMCKWVGQVPLPLAMVRFVCRAKHLSVSECYKRTQPSRCNTHRLLAFKALQACLVQPVIFHPPPSLNCLPLLHALWDSCCGSPLRLRALSLASFAFMRSASAAFVCPPSRQLLALLLAWCPLPLRQLAASRNCAYSPRSGLLGALLLIQDRSEESWEWCSCGNLEKRKQVDFGHSIHTQTCRLSRPCSGKTRRYGSIAKFWRVVQPTKIFCGIRKISCPKIREV